MAPWASADEAVLVFSLFRARIYDHVSSTSLLDKIIQGTAVIS